MWPEICVIIETKTKSLGRVLSVVVFPQVNFKCFLRSLRTKVDNF